jgi:oligoendopeptidase F
MIAERLLSGDMELATHYRAFLSSGGADYPVNQLRTAGVDMTTNEPFEHTMKKMERIMDEIEDILLRLT